MLSRRTLFRGAFSTCAFFALRGKLPEPEEEDSRPRVSIDGKYIGRLEFVEHEQTVVYVPKSAWEDPDHKSLFNAFERTIGLVKFEALPEGPEQPQGLQNVLDGLHENGWEF